MPRFYSDSELSKFGVGVLVLLWDWTDENGDSRDAHSSSSSCHIICEICIFALTWRSAERVFTVPAMLWNKLSTGWSSSRFSIAFKNTSCLSLLFFWNCSRMSSDVFILFPEIRVTFFFFVVSFSRFSSASIPSFSSAIRSSCRSSPTVFSVSMSLDCVLVTDLKQVHY